jgi:hypothetical protein
MQCLSRGARPKVDEDDGDGAGAGLGACLACRGRGGDARRRHRDAGEGRGCSSAWRPGAARARSPRGLACPGTLWTRLVWPMPWLGVAGACTVGVLELHRCSRTRRKVGMVARGRDAKGGRVCMAWCDSSHFSTLIDRSKYWARCRDHREALIISVAKGFRPRTIG